MKDAQNKAADEVLQMEIRLWDYIDGRATQEERNALEQLFRDRSEWALKYSELLETNEQLRALETEQPSLRFTKNVMEEIAKYSIAPATKQYINKNIIRGIGLFFITSICALVAYGFKDAFAGSATPGYGAAGSGIDYSAFFSSSYVSVFMMLNIILALLLLDRYLRRKQANAREF
ncbi:MAG TPA: hypothetical protein VGB56_00295 [Flavisolibacter sp.]|jgi:hypothetical protein